MSEDDDMKAYGYEGEIIAVLIPKEKQELKKPKRFKVIILNDDYTPMEFVVGILTSYFNKTIDEADENKAFDINEATKNFAVVECNENPYYESLCGIPLEENVSNNQNVTI